MHDACEVSDLYYGLDVDTIFFVTQTWKHLGFIESSRSGVIQGCTTRGKSIHHIVHGAVNVRQ